MSASCICRARPGNSVLGSQCSCWKRGPTRREGQATYGAVCTLDLGMWRVSLWSRTRVLQALGTIHSRPAFSSSCLRLENCCSKRPKFWSRQTEETKVQNIGQVKAKRIFGIGAKGLLSASAGGLSRAILDQVRGYPKRQTHRLAKEARSQPLPRLHTSSTQARRGPTYNLAGCRMVSAAREPLCRLFPVFMLFDPMC